MIQATVIPYVAPAATGQESFCTLRQDILPSALQSANLSDITAMWYMAMSGLSAADYIADRCPVEISAGIITVMLGLFVYPSSPDLGYFLTLSNGELGEMAITPLQREFDLILPQSDRVSLDFVPEDDFDFDWETEAYDAYGAVIERPELLRIERETVIFTSSCFAVLRCRCAVMAHYYPIRISVEKSVPADPESTVPDRTGYKITNFQSKVLATWQGLTEQKTSSLQLIIPDCVKSLLEMCEDGVTPSTPALNLNTKRPVVYYSSCTGEELEVRYE